MTLIGDTSRKARVERREKLNLERVKSALVHTGGIRESGGPEEVRDMAWE
jgi:hypothetical protein